MSTDYWIDNKSESVQKGDKKIHVTAESLDSVIKLSRVKKPLDLQRRLVAPDLLVVSEDDSCRNQEEHHPSYRHNESNVNSVFCDSPTSW